MTFRPSTSQLIFALLLAAGDASAQNTVSVTLTPTTSPSAGQAGVTNVSLTGSNFPWGTIPASNVTIRLTPATGGSATSTTATAVSTIAGTTRRVSFTIPGSINPATPTNYLVSLTGTTATGVPFASANSATLTVNPGAGISNFSPTSGYLGQTLTVSVTGTLTNFVQGSTSMSFGAGISVGGAAPGAFGPVMVNSPTTATAQLAIGSAAPVGPRTVSAQTGAQQAATLNAFAITLPPTPQISDFTPKSAAPGAVVTVTGSNLAFPSISPSVNLTQPGGGSVSAAVLSANSGSIAFVVPANSATGPVTISVAGQNVASSTPLTITGSAIFSLSANPGTVDVFQGKSAAAVVTLTGMNGFSSLAQLSLAGLPSGVTATIAPPNIGPGQNAVVTLTAPGGQPAAISNVLVTAASVVNGVSLSQSATFKLSVDPPTTSLIGRTVRTDSPETPLAGVTPTTLGKDGNGNLTGCLGHSTVSDAAGNFALINLPPACTGPQLIGFDGTTVKSPAGTYAGVNLIFTLASSQVTSSTVLVHLPRIDTAETFLVTQNATVDQHYRWKSIPNLAVTVYAGTTFTMPDGTQPDPFPLAAVDVPIDRLPDLKPPVPTMVMGFIVAFQPANAFTNHPVAVYYPNPLNVPPGIDMALLTLDPTHGTMVPYGTGTVSSDGTQIVPDADAANPGHLYGLVHFDWHMPGYPVGTQPNPCGGFTPCACCGDPIDLSSGLSMVNETDMAVTSARGSLGFKRTFRNNINGNQQPLSQFGLNTIPTGPFGYGSGANFDYRLAVSNALTAAAIPLVMPDGNQFVFAKQADGTFINTSVPSMAGGVMTVIDSGTVHLRWRDGSVWAFFFRVNGQGSALYIDSITDTNGNQIRFRRGNGNIVEDVIDQVGRDFHFNWNLGGHVTQITAPDGRFVSYDYGGDTGILLRQVTHIDGTTTKYDYDAAGNLTTITDGRGVVVASNTFDANGRVTQQVQADGSVLKFSYVLQNPLAPIVSPVLQTTVTDGRGNQTVYRFSPIGALIGVADALGQTRDFSRDGNNQIVAITGSAVCDTCGDPTSGDMTFQYDAQGNLLAQTDALGNKTTFKYDPTFNKVTSITDPLGNITAFTYDPKGNLTLAKDANGNVTSYGYDAFGEPTAITDATHQTTALAYNGDGDLVSITDPLNNTASFQFDQLGRMTRSSDALGRVTQLINDAMGRITSTTNPQGTTTSFVYDPIGNLLSATTQALGHCTANGCNATAQTTTFTYDKMNRLATRTDALGRSDQRGYDASGNLTQFQDRRGQINRFTYDVVNRLIGETYQDGATVGRSYDARSDLVAVNDSAAGAFAFGYDATGQLLSSNTPTGVVQYTRDALGRVALRQVAGAPAVSYTYDATGNLVGATMPQASATLAYDPRNLLSTISRLNGVTSAFAYDSSARLLDITHKSGANLLDDESYTYDPAGSRNGHKTLLGQALATPAVNAATYDQANEQLQFGSTVNTFDPNGNLVLSSSLTGNAQYTWDSRNRLVSITGIAGQTTTFQYDFAGNLLRQSDSGPTANLTKSFVLDDITNVVYEGASDGTSYSVLSGQSIDSHLAIVQSSGQEQYGLTDAINSTVTSVDQTGAVTGRFDYEPFGQTIAMGSYPFQYSGRTPVSNDLYYSRARFYNTQTGRFISEDPIADALPTAGQYRYAANNPLLFTDPTGLFDPVTLSLVGIFLSTVGNGTAAAVTGGNFREAATAGLVGATVAVTSSAFIGPLGGGLLGAATGSAFYLYEQGKLDASGATYASMSTSMLASLATFGLIDGLPPNVTLIAKPLIRSELGLLAGILSGTIRNTINKIRRRNSRLICDY